MLQHDGNASKNDFIPLTSPKGREFTSRDSGERGSELQESRKGSISPAWGGADKGPAKE